MSTLLHDVRFALRRLRRSPGLAATVVLTLALGIGANSAIFSLVHAALLQDPPYRDPARLVVVWGSHPTVGQETASLPDYLDLRAAGTRALSALAASANTALNVSGAGEPERVLGGRVTANFFDTLGVAPALGRGFSTDEERKDASQVIVLSHGYWQSKLGGRPDVLGTTMTVNGLPHTVVGVMPASFRVREETLAWVPLVTDQPMNRRADFLTLFGRLAPGATREAAQAELRAVMARLEQQYPDTNARWSVDVVPLREVLTGDVRPALLVFMGAVALVLLIACANVANLLLAEASRRGREMAVRVALGAGRGRLVRQLLTETALLAAAGAGLGLAGAVAAVDAVVAAQPQAFHLAQPQVLDTRVLAFTLGVVLLTTTLAGLAPALRLARSRGDAMLHQGGADPRARSRLKAVLVLAEVGLAVVLLACAGLLVRSFVRLAHVDPGFRPDGLTVARLGLPTSQFPQDPDLVSLQARLLERVAALPGVTAVAAATSTPLGGSAPYNTVNLEGAPPVGPEVVQDAIAVTASPGYFATVGIPVLEGREFSAFDDAKAPKVSMVNRAFVKRFLPDGNALGRRISWDGTHWFTIVGVAADTRHDGLAKDAYPQMFAPYAQAPRRGFDLVVRSDAPTTAVAAGLRRELSALAPGLPLSRVRAMEEQVHAALAQPRLTTLLLGFFAAVALVLAASGIYGVMSHAVAQRTREIGIRMALGARAADVLQLVVGQGMRPALLGVAAGLAGALAATQLLASLLYGVSPTDVPTFAAVVAGLLGTALLANWLPARRATRVVPTEALRSE